METKLESLQSLFLKHFDPAQDDPRGPLPVQPEAAPPDPERPRSLTDEARADEIKDLIEATIKSEITKWRSRMRPALLRAQQLGWSREVSRRLEQQ